MIDNSAMFWCNKWVERLAARGGSRPLPGVICAFFFNLVGQGNFTFVREKSGKSQGISRSCGCGNHGYTIHGTAGFFFGRCLLFVLIPVIT